MVPLTTLTIRLVAELNEAVRLTGYAAMFQSYCGQYSNMQRIKSSFGLRIRNFTASTIRPPEIQMHIRIGSTARILRPFETDYFLFLLESGSAQPLDI
jgi:hypothetical protein